MDTKTTTEKTGESAESAKTAEADAPAEAVEAAPAGEPLDGHGTEPLDEDADDQDTDDELAAEAAPASAGIGGAAAAVVSAALGAVALTGTWTGKVVAERETLIGQIKTSGTGTPAQQISEIYGDAWHTTALVNGVFAFVALFVAVLVLVLPGRPAWVRAVAVAGAVLGGIGLLLSAGTYFDLFLSLPSAGS
ncbi:MULTISPECIES: hypothetical protein [unclassified Streptomyces]|uniref:hypothetical protein n=1 Tax=unclassified Streptomyces TaxID=2593676 RepID=UPI00093D8425|nr:hypothetical protein [Streptomyces sp. CB02261]OKJ53865.1 hypothetical protein AMK29_30160 [Streptomyces sp. CB02261]